MPTAGLFRRFPHRALVLPQISCHRLRGCVCLRLAGPGQWPPLAAPKQGQGHSTLHTDLSAGRLSIASAALGQAEPEL